MKRKLSSKVDVGKLREQDILLEGEFRLIDESYNGWKVNPVFKRTGAETYVPFDELFEEEQLGNCYALIAQHDEHSEQLNSGYLSRDSRDNIRLSCRSLAFGNEPVYHSGLPVWMSLLDEENKPFVKGDTQLIFVQVSPWHDKARKELDQLLVGNV